MLRPVCVSKRNFTPHPGLDPPVKVLFLLFFCSLFTHAEVIRDLAYGNEPLQKLDLYLPDAKSGQPRPVIVAIHGGGWAFGDKAHANFIQPKTAWFNDHGCIVASINYRLSPAVTHPSHIEDVCAAIAWVQQHIGKHGGDPQQLILLGHSAGAHLAALAGVDHAKLKAAGADAKGIRSVILIDGAAYDAPRQIANTSLPKFKEMYLKAFTKDIEVQRDASPTLKVATLEATPPPYLILHVAARADSKDQSDRLAQALQAKGGKAKVVPVAGKTHGTINHDLGKPGDPTTTAVAEFLEFP